MTNFFSYLLLSLFVLVSNIYASNKNQKKQELKICVSGGYIPYKIKLTNGNWDGFDVSIMKDFANYLNKTPVFVDVEWASIIPSLVSFKCDMISVGLVITPERLKVVSFGNIVYENELVLAMQNINNNNLNYKSLQDLVRDNKVISVAAGTSSALYAAREKLNIMTYNGFDAPINALLTNKVDAVLFEIHYLNAMPENISSKIFILPEKVHIEKVSAAFRKDEKKLKKEFNQFVKKWSKTNNLKIYEDKYFVNDKEK
jgi:polar amino acid transport system substrate-binding protein